MDAVARYTLYPVGFGVVLGVQFSETLCWIGSGGVGAGRGDIGIAVKLTSKLELPLMDTEAMDGVNV